MTPEHESSYYEIALTNRQVLTVFVVLLTCLVAAFLSGVWIGRRDVDAVLAAAEPPPPAEQAKAQLTELNFFSDGPEGQRPKAARPRERAVEKPAEKAPPAAAPEAEKRPAPASAESPRPERTPAPDKAPPAAEAPAPPAAAAGPVIQVFSTNDAGQARRLVQRLGAGGYPAYLLQESLQGQTMYRVRVGPYGGESEARKVADELRREYRLDTWITSQQAG